MNQTTKGGASLSVCPEGAAGGDVPPTCAGRLSSRLAHAALCEEMGGMAELASDRMPDEANCPQAFTVSRHQNCTLVSV